MRQIHRAGEKLFVDFAEPTLPITTERRAHVSVDAMGASSYTFACATPAKTMEDWLGGIARALTVWGGMPQLIVPDNPRATIADPDRYEPRAGDTMLDFARHYGTSFLPARVYRPLDKTKGGSCGPSRRARFMLTAAPFHVARSVDEFAYAMHDYDEGSEWPAGSSCSFTAGLARRPWTGGFRMAHQASVLMQAMQEALPPCYARTSRSSDDDHHAGMPPRAAAVAGCTDVERATSPEAWRAAADGSG